MYGRTLNMVASAHEMSILLMTVKMHSPSTGCPLGGGGRGSVSRI